MQPEKLGRSLSWHSRFSCVSWLCGQKPCIRGLSFLPLLSPVFLGKNNFYANKIQTGCCLKENKNSPKPQTVSLSLFLVSSSLFSGMDFLRLVRRQQREKQAKSLVGILGISSCLECGAGNTSCRFHPQTGHSIKSWTWFLWITSNSEYPVICDLEIQQSVGVMCCFLLPLAELSLLTVW